MVFNLFRLGVINRKELIIFWYLKAKESRTTSFSELARFADISVLTAKSAIEKLREKELLEFEQPKVGQANFIFKINAFR